jgi:hypothetical protein
LRGHSTSRWQGGAACGVAGLAHRRGVTWWRHTHHGESGDMVWREVGTWALCGCCWLGGEKGGGMRCVGTRRCCPVSSRALKKLKTEKKKLS